MLGLQAHKHQSVSLIGALGRPRSRVQDGYAHAEPFVGPKAGLWRPNPRCRTCVGSVNQAVEDRGREPGRAQAGRCGRPSDLFLSMLISP